MLRIENLTYRIGKRVLIDRASVGIDPGHRVGLVGRNGAGKTTLLHLITGALDADEGAIELPTGWRVGITRQEAPSGPESLIDTVLSADRELASLTREAETATDPHRIAEIHTRLHDKSAHTAHARAARLLAGLGFSEAGQQRPCSEFSGGWRMRVALASLLFTQPDLLLLDEPTNHLDLEASLWLEDYLRRYDGTVLLVSHDRELLNRVVGEILHLEGGKLTLYRGGYDKFEEARRMKLAQIESERVKQEAQRAHIRKFVDRFRYKATKARQAQSRLKMLERMQPIPRHTEEGVVPFDFPQPEELPPPLYTIDNVSVGYDGRAVLSGLSLRLDADDRIALLGANGNGKSTLIKLLAGRLAPMSGYHHRSRKLRVGYFAQHQADELDLDATPVRELARRRPRDLDVDLRKHLGAFGFSQSRADTPIGSLSGGEKARLLFAMMSSDRPHILLLDEPTNHLDVQSREALVQAINAFGGAVVIVSHDPHVIELTADRLWLVDGGRVTDFDGDMEDYRALLLGKRKGDEKERKSNGAAPQEPREAPVDRREQRRQAAERRKELAPLRSRLLRAEKNVEKLEAEKAKIVAALGDPALYEDNAGRLVDLQRQHGYIERDLAAAEEAWFALQEEWEALEVETS